jgi:hypothetical protein
MAVRIEVALRVVFLWRIVRSVRGRVKRGKGGGGRLLKRGIAEDGGHAEDADGWVVGG